MHEYSVELEIEKRRATIKLALDQISEKDKRVAELISEIGYPEPRYRQPSFKTLVEIIIAQMISTQSAAAVMSRVSSACDENVIPEAILALGFDKLKLCGLSQRKCEYVLELATMIHNGNLNLLELGHKDVEEVVNRLISIRGIGRWSAEIYAMFAMGCSDIYPAEDLALRVAIQRYRGEGSCLSAKECREFVKRWAPHRSAMALLMWKYYGSTTLETSGRPKSMINPN